MSRVSLATIMLEAMENGIRINMYADGDDIKIEYYRGKWVKGSICSKDIFCEVAGRLVEAHTRMMGVIEVDVVVE